MNSSPVLLLALLGAARGRASSPPGPDRLGAVLASFGIEGDGRGEWSRLELSRESWLILVADPTGAVDRVAPFELARDDPQVEPGLLTSIVACTVARSRRVCRHACPKSSRLALRAPGETFDWTIRRDERRFTPDNRSPGDALRTGELEGGRWVEPTVHVRWSHEGEGLLRIPRNRRPIVNGTGLNAYKDERGVHFTIGTYKPPWHDPDGRSTTEMHVVYHEHA